MDIKYFKNVDFNSDYLETTIEFQNREIQLDINSDAVLGENNWVKEYEEYISKLETFKENVFGTYIHGIFENNRITEKILNIVREKKGISELKLKETFEEYREKEFDKLEKLLRENLDIEKIYEIIEDN